MSDPIISVAGVLILGLAPVFDPHAAKRKMASASGDYERGRAAGRSWCARGKPVEPRDLRHSQDYWNGFGEGARGCLEVQGGLMPTESLHVKGVGEEPVETGTIRENFGGGMRAKKKMASASGEYERGVASGYAACTHASPARRAAGYGPIEAGDYGRGSYDGWNKCVREHPTTLPPETEKALGKVSGFDLAFRG